MENSVDLIMIPWTTHVTKARLMEFAQVPPRFYFSTSEQKHIDDCVECLRGLISALKSAIENNKKE